MDIVRRISSLLIVLLALLTAQGARAADDITLGMSAAFTGPTRDLGIEMYRGAQAYFNGVNANGGINGAAIHILPSDDGYSPVPAIDNTVNFTEQQNVFSLFGYVGTPTTTRVIPLLRRYAPQNQLLLFPLTGAEQLRQPPYSKWIFNLRPSYFMETSELVDKFMLTGRQRIAVMYQADAFGRSGWDGVRKALAQFDLVIHAEATYRRGATADDDMTPQAQILAKRSPDAIILVGTSEACTAFIRDARDIGLDVPIGTVSFANPEKLARALQNIGAQNGKDYTQDFIATQVLPSYNDLSLPAVREYRRLMDESPPLPTKQIVGQVYDVPQYSYPSFEGFLAAKVLVEALTRIDGRPTRMRLKQVLETMSHFDVGIEEYISFGPQQHQALNTVYFTTINKGRIVPLNDFERWNK